MYQPRHFAETRPEVLLGLIRDHPLATVITGGEDGLTADPIQMLHVPGHGAHGVLRGHVARANPLWQRAGRDGIECLVVFNGPDGYVSPSWYATKQETGRVVPTWDYVAIQVHGELVVHDDEAWVEDVVRRLTDRHEQRRPEPWQVDDAPRDYLEGQLRGIVGIEVRIEAIEVSVKMSQNKTDADRAGVANGFDADGRPDLAQMVRRPST